MRRIIKLLIMALVATACTGEGNPVNLEQGTDPEVAETSDTSLTPFAERLYGSAWSVVQGQLEGSAVVANGAFPHQQLGGFSFYGTRTELSVSLNHECGSATSPVEITSDRITPADITIPTGCEHLTLFNLFAQPDVAAAFNNGRLELTGLNGSLAAEHFVSVSDNGAAPRYIVGEHVAVFLPWTFADPDDAERGSLGTFDVVVNPGECTGPRGPLLSPELTYNKETIELAIAAALPPNRHLMAQTLECTWPPIVTISLSEPRNGRSIVVNTPPDRPLRAGEG